MAGRFIKIYDKILQWEWYKNINVKVLFLHLLLKANYKDARFEGHLIKRGQLVTSLPSLHAETGLSIMQIRSSLEKLTLTGEITASIFPKYRVITVVHYEDYQDVNSQDNRQATGKSTAKQQANNRQVTGKQQASNSQVTASIEYIEDIERVEKIEQIEREGKTTKRFSPPSLDEVSSYIREMGSSIDPQHFVDYYAARGWELKPGQKVKDWKACVRTWMQREKKDSKERIVPKKTVVAQQYEQRDYSTQSEDMDDVLDMLVTSRR